MEPIGKEGNKRNGIKYRALRIDGIGRLNWTDRTIIYKFYGGLIRCRTRKEPRTREVRTNRNVGCVWRGRHEIQIFNKV
jgi:hypothetical protein